jgi:hypothetical protein
LGSIRLKVLENLTAGLTGWLYLREQLRPCRLHLAGFGGCRALHAFAQFSATKCSIPHHSATHALGPLLSPRPTRFTTVRFGFRPFPRGQVRDSPGTRQGGGCIETATCLTSALHSSAAVRVNALTCAHWGCVSFHRARLSVKRWLLSPSNKLEAQPESRCDPL